MATRRFHQVSLPRGPVEVRMTRLGYVARRAVGWLWPGRVPLGKVTLLVGDPGRGKSLLALDMAARVTRGLPWPDGGTVGSRQAALSSGEEAVGRRQEAVGRDEEAGGTRHEAVGSEQTAVGSRQEAVGSEEEAEGTRQDAVGSPEEKEGSRQAAVGGRGGTDSGGASPLFGMAEMDPRRTDVSGSSLPTGSCLPPTAPCLLPTVPIEPAGRVAAQPPASVILLSAEDDPADTIRPRLEAAGGDPDRVLILQSIRKPGSGREGDLMFSLSQDLVALEAAIKSCQDVRLVIMDPVSAYLSGVDSHSNAGMREVLAPLRAVAERTGVAVLAISHLTKRAEASVLYRAMGSLAFVAAARAVWAVGPDRQTAGRMLFLPVKCNLAGGVTGMAYRIVGSPKWGDVPVISWEGAPVAMTAEEALEGTAHRALLRREEAGLWLAGVLSSGPMASKEVEARAWEAGFSKRTLVRAKEVLKVVAYHERYQSAWLWRLPGAEAPCTGEPVAAAPTVSQEVTEAIP